MDEKVKDSYALWVTSAKKTFHEIWLEYWLEIAKSIPLEKQWLMIENKKIA